VSGGGDCVGAGVDALFEPPPQAVKVIAATSAALIACK